MRMFVQLFVVTVLLSWTVGIVAQQPAGKPAPTPAPQSSAAKPAPPQPQFRPVATIQEIMATMIDPASKIVFGAVGTTATNGVEQQKEPKTDEEWAVVRENALLMIEGSNLIMMSGRHVAAPSLANKAGAGELTAAQIETRLAKDRAAWNKLAREFGVAAGAALKAADAKSPDGVMESGEGIDAACENCHLRFWYPDQEKLFQKK